MAKTKFQNNEVQLLQNAQNVYYELDKCQKNLLNEIEKRRTKFMKDDDITDNVEMSKANNADYKIIKDMASAKIELLKLQKDITLKSSVGKEEETEMSMEEMQALIKNVKEK